MDGRDMVNHSSARSGVADHSGHSEHSGHVDHVARFRRLFWVMLVLAVPVLVFSSPFAELLGYNLPASAWAAWVSPVLGTVMFGWGGRPFLTGAAAELRTRSPGMMLLVALAISVAFAASWGASLGILSSELDFWWELALLIVIMLLGHWLEMRSLAQSSSALDSLAALLPDTAERLDAGQVTVLAPAQLRVGDFVIVRPGGRIPADGLVTEGAADVDEAMITGESRPVRRGAGDPVVAGTVATDTALRLRVSAVSSPKHKHPRPAPNASPTRRPAGCSGSLWVSDFSPPSPGPCSAARKTPWCAPSPCWSSRARTRWAWPSRSSWRS
jgi:Cu2+-exporting ATPase